LILGMLILVDPAMDRYEMRVECPQIASTDLDV
jgi:hypothetical protein